MIGLALPLFIVFVVVSAVRLGARFARENKRIDALLEKHRQGFAIDDAADMATDGEEREISI
jgi:hypothetical protein